jgi:hypothetical protein
MPARASAVVAQLWQSWGPPLVLALLTALGVLLTQLTGTWERERRQVEAQVAALRQDLVDTKYRIVVLEVQLAQTRDAVRERELHDRDQWHSIEALERRPPSRRR